MESKLKVSIRIVDAAISLGGGGLANGDPTTGFDKTSNMVHRMMGGGSSLCKQFSFSCSLGS